MGGGGREALQAKAMERPMIDRSGIYSGSFQHRVKETRVTTPGDGKVRSRQDRLPMVHDDGLRHWK
jgi:hypothetical protein